MAPPITPPQVRFDAKWVEEDRGYLTLCHIWKAGKFQKTGYAMFAPRRGKTVLGHRWILEQTLGSFEGQANHHCDQNDCVNPQHLYVGTQKQNVADMIERGRHPHMGHTHCPTCGTGMAHLYGQRRCPKQKQHKRVKI